MKKNYLAALLLGGFCTLSYLFNAFGFLLAAMAAVSLLVFLITSTVRYFRKDVSRNWVKIPLMLVAVCVVAIPVNFIRPYAPALSRSANVSKVLQHAYTTDQGDRKTLKTYLPGFRQQVRERDSLRIAQVKHLYRNHRITKPMDKFHAAFVLHHSRESELYEIAHTLASEAAAAGGLENALQVQWLKKATYDRWMISIGKPQKYATQNGITVTSQ